MKPFTPEELAAFIDEQYTQVCIEDSRGYVLKGDEFTLKMYCDGGDVPPQTASNRLARLVEAGRLRVRKENMNGRATNVYTITEAL